MTRPLRFGVLGAAKIAPGALIQPAKLGSEATVDVVAARDPERARRYAAEHGIPRVARDYAEVVHDPARAQFKAVLVGPPGETAALLRLIKGWVAGED